MRAWWFAVASVCALYVSGITDTRWDHAPRKRLVAPLPRGATLVVQATCAKAPCVGVRARAFLLRDGSARLVGEQRGAAPCKDLPAGEYWIVVDAEGMARASTMLVLADNEARELSVALAEGRSLEVRVVDESGAPIAGAEVEVRGADSIPIGARTTDTGSTRVEHVAQDRAVVSARGAGFDEASSKIAATDSVVTLTLRKLGSLRVTVTGPDDKPQKGARVDITGPGVWPSRSAETGADGTVFMRGLAAGSFALRAVRGELVSPTEFGIVVNRGSESTVALKLAPASVIDVEVQSDEDDQRIAGARITATESGLSFFPLEAVTGKDGHARIGPLWPTTLTLVARAEGYVPRFATIGEPFPRATKLRLGLAGAITGRVVDARGFPVDGATLSVLGTDIEGRPFDEDPGRSAFREAHFAANLGAPKPLLPAGELGVMPGPVPPIPRGDVTRVAPDGPAPGEPWTTRSDGTFRLSPVSTGKVFVVARHPQYLPAWSEPLILTARRDGEVSIVMRAGGTLEGRVVDAAGKPVPGATVSVASRAGGFDRSVKTALDGAFAFMSVPERLSLAVARADDPLDVAARAEIEVPEQARKTIELVIPPARGQVEVRVVDDRGYPVATAEVHATSLDPKSPAQRTTFSDANGDAAIAGMLGLPLRIETRAPGFASHGREWPETTKAVRVELQRGETIEGEIRCKGQPSVAEVTVYGALGVRTTRSDARGHFMVRDLGRESIRIAARAEGCAPLVVPVSVRASSRPQDVGRLELAAEAIIEGRVEDDRGQPVGGARVTVDARLATLPATVTTVTGRDGNFRLAALPAATIALDAVTLEGRTGRVADLQPSVGTTLRDVRIRVDASRAPRSVAPMMGDVGIRLGETAEHVVVASVQSGSEAERAGVMWGDTILAIDGVTVHGIESARARLRGAVGDSVMLSIERAGARQTLHVPRERLP